MYGCCFLIFKHQQVVPCCVLNLELYMNYLVYSHINSLRQSRRGRCLARRFRKRGDVLTSTGKTVTCASWIGSVTPRWLQECSMIPVKIKRIHRENRKGSSFHLQQIPVFRDCGYVWWKTTTSDIKVTIFSPAKTPVPGYVSGSTTVPK